MKITITIIKFNQICKLLMHTIVILLFIQKNQFDFNKKFIK